MAKHEEFGDLREDLQRLSRRRMLGLFAALPLAGCLTANDEGDMTDAAASSSGDGGTCSTIPTETAGPYPADGTNGPNALTESGIVRANITTSFGDSSGTAAGVPLTVTLTLVDSTTCSPLAGYAIYLWHCDRDGNYSLYTATDQNYLRGVQVTDDNGQVTFTSIFPACYSGRWPHIHFEVYASVDEATNGSAKVAVSQLAMPKATCDVVYATTGYSASVTNLAQITLATDNVFSDGATLQIPAIAGSVSAGYAATLTAAIDV
ncbi:MAG TPA: intradiol ring-cleavage dioxygenase [Kofleriaceae bacterium]|jgi:protocatechuate 3,4-dioxygenase beta subunit